MDYQLDEMQRGTLLPFCKDYTGRSQRIYVRYEDALLRSTRGNDFDVTLYGFCVRYGTVPIRYEANY